MRDKAALTQTLIHAPLNLLLDIKPGSNLPKVQIRKPSLLARYAVVPTKNSFRPMSRPSDLCFLEVLRSLLLASFELFGDVILT